MSNYESHRQALAKCSEHNKDAVFDCLAAANITKVIVEFDGEGDSGQISSVSAMRDKETVELPVTTVTLRRLSWGATESVAEKRSLARCD